jgi:hypothetical protein
MRVLCKRGLHGGGNAHANAWALELSRKVSKFARQILASPIARKLETQAGPLVGDLRPNLNMEIFRSDPATMGRPNQSD